MNDKQLYLIISLGIVIVFTITNPSYDDHKREVTKMITKIVLEKEEKTESTNKWEALGSQLGAALGSKFIDTMLDNFFSVQNYIIFSVGIFERADDSNIISIGVLGNVFKLKPEYLNLKSDSTLSNSSSKNQITYQKPTNTYGLTFNELVYSEYPFWIKCRTDVSKNFDGKVLFEIENYGIELVDVASFKFQNKYVGDSKSITKNVYGVEPEGVRGITVNFKNSNIDILKVVRVEP